MESSAIFALVTAPFCILAVATELSEGVVKVVAVPICVINKLDPATGGSQNLIPSAPSSANPSPLAS